jgi:hypothetical protein
VSPLFSRIETGEKTSVQIYFPEKPQEILVVMPYLCRIYWTLQGINISYLCDDEMIFPYNVLLESELIQSVIP